MTTSTIRPVRPAPIAAVASRAILAAALAVATTFSVDHTAPYGLLVLGIWLIAQAALLLVWTPRLARGLEGRLLLVARAVISLLGGALSLVVLAGLTGEPIRDARAAGLDALRPIEAVVFLLLGVLEVVGAVRRSEGPELAGDGIVVGGLSILVGLMLVILDPDPVLTVGVLSAWGALVAVYLGISAANLRAKRRRA